MDLKKGVVLLGWMKGTPHIVQGESIQVRSRAFYGFVGNHGRAEEQSRAGDIGTLKSPPRIRVPALITSRQSHISCFKGVMLNVGILISSNQTMMGSQKAGRVQSV